MRITLSDCTDHLTSMTWKSNVISKYFNFRHSNKASEALLTHAKILDLSPLFQEYLQYQQQLALQRLQEQEREMQMRQEQMKQQQQMRQVQYTATSYHGQQMMGMPPPQQGMAPPPGAGQMLPGQYSQQPQVRK